MGFLWAKVVLYPEIGEISFWDTCRKKIDYATGVANISKKHKNISIDYS